MPDDQSPEKLRFNAVITVNDSIAGVDDIACMGNIEVRVTFQNAVDGFSHYLCFTFDSQNPQLVFFEHIEATWIIVEESLKLFDCVDNILQMFQNIFINHKSIV